MKILIDMNLSPRGETVLSAEGISSAHWYSIGSATAPDAEITARTRDDGWVILTQDLDFGTTLAITRGEEPSGIQTRSEDVGPESAAKAVIATVRQTSAEPGEGALVQIDPRQTRLRYLPLYRQR